MDSHVSQFLSSLIVPRKWHRLSKFLAQTTKTVWLCSSTTDTDSNDRLQEEERRQDKTLEKVRQVQTG